MFLGRLAMARPFGSVEALFAGAREIAHAMPLDEKLELIDAHPRLGAPPAEVSALSYVEQGYGGSGTERTAERAVAEAAGDEPRPSEPASPPNSTVSMPPTKPASGSATASSSPVAHAPSCSPR